MVFFFYVYLTGFDFTYVVQLVSPQSDSGFVAVQYWIKLNDKV